MSGPTPAQSARDLARRRWLAIAAAATAGATAWAALQPNDTPHASALPRPRAERPAADAAPRGAERTAGTPAPAPTWPEAPDALRRANWRSALPQGVAAWSAPAPAPTPRPALVAPPTPTAPAPPQAPAFPYTLIGRLDDGEPCALLSGPQRSFGAKVADVIDGNWRVDAIQAQGVTLTWLPGGIQKTLAFASS